MLTYTHVSVCARVCLGISSVRVCLRVYTHTEASIHLRTRIDTGVNTRAHMCRDVGIHRHIHTNTCGRVNAYRCTRVYTCDVCAQVWMHVYAYPYVHACIDTHICVCMCTRVCTHVCIRTDAYVDVYIEHMYIHTDVRVSMCLHTHVCVCVCTYIYIYVHTHT